MRIISFQTIFPMIAMKTKYLDSKIALHQLPNWKWNIKICMCKKLKSVYIAFKDVMYLKGSLREEAVENFKVLTYP